MTWGHQPGRRARVLQFDARLAIARVPPRHDPALEKPGIPRRYTAVSEEQTTDYRVRPGILRHLEFYVPREFPHQVLAVGESRKAPAVQNRSRTGVQHLDRFCAVLVVPIQTVNGDLVRASIREVDVNRETVPAEPCGRDPVARRVLLERAWIRSRSRPGIKRLPGRVNRSETRIGGRIADHGVPVCPIGAFPITHGPGIRFHELRRRATRAKTSAEEHTAKYSVWPRGSCYLESHMSLNVPHQVRAVSESGNAAAVHDRSRYGIHHRNRLRPALIIPVEAVNRYLVR